MDQKHETPVISAWRATEFVWEVLMSVAIPTALSALAGRWFDRRFNLAPWGTIVGLVIAVALSGALVYRKANQYKELTNTPHD